MAEATLGTEHAEEVLGGDAGGLWESLEALLRKVNKECDVEGLCNGFPKRIKLLEENGGDRLPH